MKIEMGESLLQSYLKHTKKCIISQTNWKTSSNWNIDENTNLQLKKTFEKIKANTNFSEVFKNNGLTQILRQAEIDVVGVNKEEKVYMVEVAFHEGGLNYGDKDKIRNKIYEKLLRAYLIGLAYFQEKRYEIIFATPKTNHAVQETIEKSFDDLQKEFGSEKVIFKFITNEDFKNEVLLPTLQTTEEDADSNELFLRTYKMLEMFDLINKDNISRKPHKIITIKTIKPSTDKKESDSEKLLRDWRSVGFTTFVKYYKYYKNPSYTSGDIKQLLRTIEGFELSSCATKASTGKSIINRGAGKSALKIISDANNIDKEIIRAAHELWKEEI